MADPILEEIQKNIEKRNKAAVGKGIKKYKDPAVQEAQTDIEAFGNFPANLIAAKSGRGPLYPKSGEPGILETSPFVPDRLKTMHQLFKGYQGFWDVGKTLVSEPALQYIPTSRLRTFGGKAAYRKPKPEPEFQRTGDLATDVAATNIAYAKRPWTEQIVGDVINPANILPEAAAEATVGPAIRAGWRYINPLRKFKDAYGNDVYTKQFQPKKWLKQLMGKETAPPGLIEEDIVPEALKTKTLPPEPSVLDDIQIAQQMPGQPTGIIPVEEKLILPEQKIITPSEFDMSKEAMEKWRAEFGDIGKELKPTYRKEPVLVGTEDASLRAGGQLRENVDVYEMKKNNWVIDYVRAKKNFNPEFDESPTEISFPWSSTWKQIQARRQDQPFQPATIEDMEAGYVVMYHGTKEIYDKFGRHHILMPKAAMYGIGIYLAEHPFVARNYAGMQHTEGVLGKFPNVRMMAIKIKPGGTFDIEDTIAPGSRNYKMIELLKRNMEKGTPGISREQWQSAVSKVLEDGPRDNYNQGWDPWLLERYSGRADLRFSFHKTAPDVKIKFGYMNLDDFANSEPTYMGVMGSDSGHYDEYGNLYDHVYNAAMDSLHEIGFYTRGVKRWDKPPKFVSPNPDRIEPDVDDFGYEPFGERLKFGDDVSTYLGYNPLPDTTGNDLWRLVNRVLEILDNSNDITPYLLQSPIPLDYNTGFMDPPGKFKRFPRNMPGIGGRAVPLPEEEIPEYYRSGLNPPQPAGRQTKKTFPSTTGRQLPTGQTPKDKVLAMTNDMFRSAGYETIHHKSHTGTANYEQTVSGMWEDRMPEFSGVLARGLKSQSEKEHEALKAYARGLILKDKLTIPKDYMAPDTPVDVIDGFRVLNQNLSYTNNFIKSEQQANRIAEMMRDAYKNTDLYNSVWILDVPDSMLWDAVKYSDANPDELVVPNVLEYLSIMFRKNPSMIPTKPANKLAHLPPADRKKNPEWFTKIDVDDDVDIDIDLYDYEGRSDIHMAENEMLPKDITGARISTPNPNMPSIVGDTQVLAMDLMDKKISRKESLKNRPSVMILIGKSLNDEGKKMVFTSNLEESVSYIDPRIVEETIPLVEYHWAGKAQSLEMKEAAERARVQARGLEGTGAPKIGTKEFEPTVDLSKGVPLDTLPPPPPPGRTIPPAAIAVGAGAGVGTGLGAGVHALSQREKPIPPPQPISPIPPVETLGDSEFAPKPDPTRIQEAALPWGQIGKGIARVGKEAIKKVWDPSEFVTTLQKVGKGEKFGKDLDESLKVKPELVKKDSSWLSGKVRMPWMGKVLSWMDESELLPISVPKGIKEADIFQRAPVSKREQFNENLIAYLTDPDGWGKLHPDGRPMWQHVREDIQATGYQDASELVDVIREMAEEVNELQLGRLAEVQKIRSAVTPELAQAGAGARKIPRGERAEAISISQRKAAARAGEAFEETTTAQMPKSATQILDEIIERRGMSGRTSGAKTQEFILGDLYLAMREINEDLFEYSQRHILPGYDIPNQFGDTIKGPWDLFNYSENVGAMFNPTKALLPGTYTLNMMQSIFGPVVTEPLRIARIKAQHTYLRSIANKLPESIRKSFVELLDTIQKADTETEGWNALKAFKKFGADPASSAYIGIVRHSPTDWLTDLFGAGKTVYSTFDNSIPLIQSYPLLTENPKIWFNAWKVSARAWLPGGGGSVDETLEAIRRDPDYNIGARLGLIIPRRGTGQDIEAAELLKTPIGRLFRHLWPTAAQAENAAIGFLSSARFNYFKQQYAWELALKRKTNGVDAVLTDKEIKDIINWTHMITGRGPLNYIGVTEKATLEGKGRMAQAIMNAVFFSPRKFSADLTYVPALFKRMQQGKFSGSPQEMQFARMMAQQNVRGAIVMFYRGLIFLKTIAFLHGLREMTGLDRGVEPVFDWLEDNLDASFKPGGRFMKFRIGKTWDSPFGSQAPMMSASYEMAFKEKYSTSGEKIATNYMDTIWRLGRGRLSPVTGETLSYILGRGWGGEVYDFKKDIKKPGLRGWLKGQKIDRSSFWFRHMSSISMETFFDIWDTSVVQKELTNDIKEELGLPIDKPTPKNFWEFLKTNPDDAAIAAVSAIAGFHGRGQTYQQPEETISEATGVPVEDLPSRALNVGEKVIREKEYERTGVVRGTEFDEIKRERDAAINQIQYNVVEYAGQNKTVMDWFNTYGSATNMPMSLKTKVGRIFFDVTQEYRYKFQAEIEKREGKPEGLMYREPDLEARREGMDFKNKALSIWYEQAARASSINDYTQKLENFVKGIENEKTLSKEEQNEVINFIYGSAYPYDIPEWLYAFLPPTTRAKIDRTRKISEFTIDKARDNKVDNNR